MNVLDMPRKRVNFRIDDRVIEALEDLAGQGKINQFVEGLLITFLQNSGRLPSDFEKLPESRGGKRSGAGKPRKPAEMDPIDSTEEEEEQQCLSEQVARVNPVPD